MENKKTINYKKTFIALLIASIIYFTFAVTGIVFAFIYVSVLGIYQSLIIFGIVVVAVILAIFTSLYFTKSRE